MLNVSYNLSSRLVESLSGIEQIRKDILSLSLSPKSKLFFRWENTVERIYFALSLSGKIVKQDQIEKTLALQQTPRKLKKQEEDIVLYKKALEYIAQYWTTTDQTVRLPDILTLYDIACYGKLRTSQKDLHEILSYVQQKKENPVIDAGVTLITLLLTVPFSSDNERIALLSGVLMLYKSGYDFDGYVNLEKYYIDNLPAINSFKTNLQKSLNITLWLEYFAQSFLIHLEDVKKKLSGKQLNRSLNASYSHLTDRQNAILQAFDYPQSRITNKKIQALFKISQITASRDLQKLASLGLLYPHGRGRSVYYTRI
ncbi:MAG TPA: hypothetical protein VLF68_01690 [Candidatus Saccharimonadales bacterium]|nr:hypothetical protein [Candidatus Saccharimonadales bacterium]